MSFYYPRFLWLLLLLIPYAFVSGLFLKKLHKWLKSSAPSGIRIKKRLRYFYQRFFSSIFAALFWLFAVLAAAQPGEGIGALHRQYDNTIIIVLDVSNSMLSPMANSTRLDNAKQFVRTLRASTEGINWALIAFKGKPVLLSPPTEDWEAFDNALIWASPSFSDVPGSEIGTAILMAAEIIKEGKAGIIIISDGNDTGGNMENAVQTAGKSGHRMMLIAAGDDGRYPIYDEFGRTVLDEDGKGIILGMADLEMEKAAEKGGAHFVRLDDRTLLDRAMKFIEPMVSISSGRTTSTYFRAVFSGLAFIFLMAVLLLVMAVPGVE